MKTIASILGFCMLFSMGCTGSYNRDTTLYQRSGRAKPIVAVLPVIDSSDSKLVNWELSQEMTEQIRKRVFNSSKLYLLRQSGGVEVAKQLNVPNPKEVTKTALEGVGAAEFVVVAEMLDEQEMPYRINDKSADKSSKEPTEMVLSLAMRVRVLDVRGDQPKVILQEVVNHEQLVTRPYSGCNYEKTHWGTEAYERTPLGMAHGKIAREIVARVEGYVGACKG